MGRKPFQELPLLPGEYEFMAERDLLNQFGDFQHKILNFEIEGYDLKVESILVHTDVCPCSHDLRPTICRLYPALPVFDIDGRLIATETMGIYEEMERIAGLAPACRVDTLSMKELNKFLAITEQISRCPHFLYYLEAYRMTKQHASRQLQNAVEQGSANVFVAFEMGFLKNNLLDPAFLRDELSCLAAKFKQRYGATFERAMRHPENVAV